MSYSVSVLPCYTTRIMHPSNLSTYQSHSTNVLIAPNKQVTCSRDILPASHTHTHTELKKNVPNLAFTPLKIDAQHKNSRNKENLTKVEENPLGVRFKQL